MKGIFVVNLSASKSKQRKKNLMLPQIFASLISFLNDAQYFKATTAVGVSAMK